MHAAAHGKPCFSKGGHSVRGEGGKRELVAPPQVAATNYEEEASSFQLRNESERVYTRFKVVTGNKEKNCFCILLKVFISSSLFY